MRHSHTEKHIYVTQNIIYHKWKQILPFATPWVDLEGMPSEISQRKTTLYNLYYLCNLNKLNSIKKKEQVAD